MKIIAIRKGFIDLTGQKFGKLNVMKHLGIVNGRTSWECRCECGNVKIVSTKTLKNGDTKSCGNHRRLTENLIGKRFGRLVVDEFVGNDKTFGFQWKCKCDCETLCTVSSRRLLSGNTKSCGCLREEIIRNGANKKHGFARTAVYNSWNSMMNRCYGKDNNKGNILYYRNKGIIVCSFLQKFENFYEFMGDRPKEMSIDRIDNNKNYSCGNCKECLENGWKMNCRWATDEIQMGNTSHNTKITINGETKILKKWCENFNIPASVVCCRVKRLKISYEDALKKPYKKFSNRVYITYNGETNHVYGWAKKLGIHGDTLSNRIFKLGWPIEKAFTISVK